ncbi:hypothetical protein H2203_000538 [Taxawa tesnikishii (nom. ined.)]|nr:hypothetical protein H2203_000538 [Dothideales sp. JES 119]
MDSGGGTGTGTGTPLLLHRNATLVLGASAPLVVRLMMLLDGFSFLFTASFNSLCIFAALAWIIYRAFQVLNKPLDELVSLLGFEIPVGPTIDLADIKANGVVIHWKPADDRRSTHKHEVQVNGRIVGDVSHSETSIVISGLQPEHFYVIRLIVVNAQDFRSPSEPIRIFTKPAESGDFFSTAAASSTSDDEEIPPEQSAIVIRPLKAFPDVLPLPTVAPPMVREVSNGPGQPRRSVSTAARRPSPAVLGIDTQQPVPEESNEPPVPEESQQQLAKRFDDTGREIREVEKQLQEEEQEAVATKAELLKERDEARADLKKKEENTRKLRKEVNALERDNAAAHSKRVAQERILNEKRNERQKLKDDTALWEKDAQEMEEEMTRLEADKKAFWNTRPRRKLHCRRNTRKNWAC